MIYLTFVQVKEEKTSLTCINKTLNVYKNEVDIKNFCLEVIKYINIFPSGYVFKGKFKSYEFGKIKINLYEKMKIKDSFEYFSYIKKVKNISNNLKFFS